MWWVIFRYVKIILVSTGLALIFSVSVNAWSTDSSPDYQDSDIKVLQAYPCPGNFGTITVNGNQISNACIMGSNTKVAWYIPLNGPVTYAVSFPLGNNFYKVDVCQGVVGCVYAEQTDTFIGFTGIRQNFVANLKMVNENGTIHYTPKENLTPFSVSQFGGQAFIPQTLATSQNGKWALIELREYGILRINTKTLEVRRISAPGVNYGYGNDPRIEMAISNDGTMVAMVGTRTSIMLIKVDETCGDTPNPQMQLYYQPNVVACKYVPTPPSKYIQDFRHAVRPVFSADGKSLSFDAFSYTADGRHFTLFSNDSDSRVERQYMALGDSFTSGEGETDDMFYFDGPHNKCHVSKRSYPYLLGNSWDLEAHSTACSGATIQTARGTSAKSNQPIQLEVLESLAPQMATISLGGNDAGLIGKLKDCLGIDTCKWASTPENRHRTAMEIKNLFPSLKSFYTDAKFRTLGPVVVVGYPRIITDGPGCSGLIGTLLDQTERIFMNEAIGYLNKVMQAAARDVGIEYFSIENVLAGGELCSSFESPLMNAFRFGDDYPNITSLPFIKIVGAESFHPKPAAHVKIASKIYNEYSDTTNIITTNSGYPTQVPEPSAYWTATTSGLNWQKAIPFLTKFTIKKKDFFQISFPVFTFKPGTEIVLELHSEVKNLGKVRSNEDGSLTATISSADFEPGFHSVHAIGKDFAENDVDTYDFLEVEEEGIAPTAQSDEPNIGETKLDTVKAKSPPAYPIPSSNVMNNDGSSAVLGSSIVHTPIKNIALLLNDETKRNPISPSKNSDYKWLFILAIIGVLLISAGAVFGYNRTKNSS